MCDRLPGKATDITAPRWTILEVVDLSRDSALRRLSPPWCARCASPQSRRRGRGIVLPQRRRRIVQIGATAIRRAGDQMAIGGLP